MNPATRAAVLALALCALAVRLPGAVATSGQAISAEDLLFFESRIRPVLVDRCYKCHSHDADKIKGGLMLDTREGLLHGGDTGPAVDPGKPQDSLIIDAISYKDQDLQMPPKGERLSDQQVADLTEWIRRGAPDPRSLVARGSSSAYGGVGRDHWSFLPVKRQAVPAVLDASWCRTPVDNFILARLEGNAMKPNPRADKYTLIRRATFDVTGLPPTEAEVQRFLVDDSPDAWAKVVDRLLDSPRYGERWGRYWLDVARYADTKGDTPQREDPRYPFAWTYRDYVIDAFNSDKPYNQFIVEQLAADVGKDLLRHFLLEMLKAVLFVGVCNLCGPPQGLGEKVLQCRGEALPELGDWFQISKLLNPAVHSFSERLLCLPLGRLCAITRNVTAPGAAQRIRGACNVAGEQFEVVLGGNKASFRLAVLRDDALNQ